MSAIQLKEGVWSVGVLNPALRVFDIVMEAKYGTSYNAYLVTGEKNVLIETVHAEYFEEYVDNITSVIPLEQIDYLIMNHNEPDHSGSVAMLMERCPNLKIFATAAGKKHMEDVANRALPIQIVKAGDTLDLGAGKVLEFIPAPMLHWADSMFTWDPADKVAFTCDFLGCHFCEPTMLDKNIHDKAAYEGEFYNYYGGIFSPFKPFVLKGLNLLPAEAEMVCPSHGPVLVERLQWAKDEYRRLSTVAPKAVKDAAVIYASAYGCTKALAEAAAEALKADGLNVTCLALFTWWVLWFMGMGALTPEDELLATIGPALQSESREPAVWCLLPSWPTLQPLVQLLLDTPTFFAMFWNACKLAFPQVAGQLVVAAPAAWACMTLTWWPLRPSCSWRKRVGAEAPERKVEGNAKKRKSGDDRLRRLG